MCASTPSLATGLSQPPLHVDTESLSCPSHSSDMGAHAHLSPSPHTLWPASRHSHVQSDSSLGPIWFHQSPAICEGLISTLSASVFPDPVLVLAAPVLLAGAQKRASEDSAVTSPWLWLWLVRCCREGQASGDDLGRLLSRSPWRGNPVLSVIGFQVSSPNSQRPLGIMLLPSHEELSAFVPVCGPANSPAQHPKKEAEEAHLISGASRTICTSTRSLATLGGSQPVLHDVLWPLPGASAVKDWFHSSHRKTFKQPRV